MPAPKSLTRLIELLHEALRAQLHHAPDHPAAVKSQADLEAFLPALLLELGTVRLVATGVGFTYEGETVGGAPNAAMTLARVMDARDVGGLVLIPGLDPAEITTLLFVLQMRPQRLAEMGGASTLLPDDGLIRVLPRFEPTIARKESPLRASEVALDWEKVFAPPAPAPAPAPLAIPEYPDPIPWVDAPVGRPPAPMPVTVPEAFPEPEPLTPEELSRIPVPQTPIPAPAPAPEPPPIAEEPPEPPAPTALSPAALREELTALFRAAMASTTSVDKAGPRSPWGVDHRESLGRFGFLVPDYACMAGAGARLRLDMTDPGVLKDALRRTFGDFEASEQGNLLLGLPGFPPAEQALRRALDFLAPELLAQAVAFVHVTHRPSMFDLALLTVALLQCAADRELSMEAIRGRLQFEGWGMQEVEEFKEAIQWECQGTDTKLHMSLERHAIHRLDPHLVKTLGRQLIRAKRVDDLRSMLAQLEEELASPQEGVRRHGTEILANLADGLPGAGLPMDLENRMLAAARSRLLADGDQMVCQWSAMVVEAVFNRWIPAGNFGALHNEVRSLGDLAYPKVGAGTWKPQMLRDLLARLGSASNIADLAKLLFQKAGAPPAPHVHAVLALIGAPAAAHLAAHLEEEEDPGRRAHLVDALRAIGMRAVPVLRDLLASSRPDLVNDALMLLAQAGDREAVPDMLLAVGHHDMQVRRTAATAVAALAGKAAAARALAEILAESDAATQLETLNMIGDLGDPEAVPAIVALLNLDRAAGDEAQRLRLRAVETLGKLPCADAVRSLQELFQKKGIFKGREPVGIRIAAAKALAAINTQEARESMALAIENESAEEVKAILRQHLVR